MFDKKVNENIEMLWDAVYLLQVSVRELRDEVDYLADLLDSDA